MAYKLKDMTQKEEEEEEEEKLTQALVLSYQVLKMTSWNGK